MCVYSSLPLPDTAAATGQNLKKDTEKRITADVNPPRISCSHQLFYRMFRQSDVALQNFPRVGRKILENQWLIFLSKAWKEIKQRHCKLVLQHMIIFIVDCFFFPPVVWFMKSTQVKFSFMSRLNKPENIHFKGTRHHFSILNCVLP